MKEKGLNSIMEERISFGNKYHTHGFQNQFTDVLINGRYAFREFAYFPHNFFQENRVSYEFLYNGIKKDKWKNLCHAAGLKESDYVIWENQYGEGFWLTVFENLEAAVKIWDLMRLPNPN